MYDPALPGERRQAITTELQAGRFGRVLALCRVALTTTPTDHGIHQLLGIASASLGNGDLALSALSRATWLELDGEALINLAVVLNSSGRNDHAMRAIRRGISLLPQSLRGWEIWRQARPTDEFLALGRICSVSASPVHELARARIGIEAGHAGAMAVRLRALLHGRPEWIDGARTLLAAVDSLCRSSTRDAASWPESRFDRGLRLLPHGRLEEAATTFYEDLVEDPASVGARAAYASVIHLLSNAPPPRLEIPEIGAVEVMRIGGALRLVPRDRTPRGSFLFGYDAGGVLLPETDARFRRHSNQWESRAIARMLLELGFAVDLVGLFDAWPSPESYDGVFCLHNALSRHASRLSSGCRKIMLLTGSSPDFQNAQEARRLHELKARTGATAPLVRSLDDVAGELASLRLTDECWLFGNETTRATYEPAVQAKIKLLSPSGAVRRGPRTSGFGGDPRRWLWFSGHGAVLKGLDRVIEIFLRRPEWRLEIVGPAAEEPWFRAAYGDRVSRSGTIAIHGTMSPVSFDFSELIEGCGAFLAPSASEGQSTSAITCLQAGLYPVLSRQCGLDLPAGCGVMLETCGLDEIEAAIEAVQRLSEPERRRQVEATTADARSRFSRDAFKRTLAGYLREATRLIGG